MNCRILRNGQLITEDLWVRDGKIINPEKVFFDEKVQACNRIDCKNAIISPGFIDLQINGRWCFAPKFRATTFGLSVSLTESIDLISLIFLRGLWR